jgi:hypothetical protein
MSSGIISKQYGYVNRRSIRLKGYDYSKSGAYFITLCVHYRKCIFGDIFDGKMILNDAGKMVQIICNEMPLFYNGIDTDQFQIMPNHFHGIIIINGPAGAREIARRYVFIYKINNPKETRYEIHGTFFFRNFFCFCNFIF